MKKKTENWNCFTPKKIDYKDNDKPKGIKEGID